MARSGVSSCTLGQVVVLAGLAALTLPLKGHAAYPALDGRARLDKLDVAPALACAHPRPRVVEREEVAALARRREQEGV